MLLNLTIMLFVYLLHKQILAILILATVLLVKFATLETAIVEMPHVSIMKYATLEFAVMIGN